MCTICSSALISVFISFVSFANHVPPHNCIFCKFFLSLSNQAKKKKISDKKVSTFLSLPLHTWRADVVVVVVVVAVVATLFSVVSFAAQQQPVHQCTVFTEIFHISSLPTIGTLLLHSRHIVKCWIVNNTRAFAIFAFHHLFYKSWLCAEFAIFIFFFSFCLCPFRACFSHSIASVIRLLHWNPLHSFHSVSVCLCVVAVFRFFIDAAFPLSSHFTDIPCKYFDHNIDLLLFLELFGIFMPTECIVAVS